MAGWRVAAADPRDPYAAILGAAVGIPSAILGAVYTTSAIYGYRTVARCKTEITR